MSNIDQLKAAFKSASTNNQNNNESREPSNYYNFWNMEIDQSTTIRFLPDRDNDNPLRFMLEKHMHELQINGQKRRVQCLKMYGDECPICKVSQGFYKEGDKVNGLKYYRKKSYIAQALIIEDPLPIDPVTKKSHEGEVRFLSITSQIFKVINEAFQSGDLEEPPYDFYNGYNFVIKKTKQTDDKANYTFGTKFKAKPTSLTPDEVELVEEKMVELKSLLPAKPAVEKVEAMLQASLNGGTYEDSPKQKPSNGGQNLAQQLASAMNNSGDDDFDADEPASKNSEVKSSSKPVATPAPAASANSDEEGEEEADEMIRRIRERRAARGV